MNPALMEIRAWPESLHAQESSNPLSHLYHRDMNDMNKGWKGTSQVCSSLCCKIRISAAVHGCILFYPLHVPKWSQSSHYCQALSPNLMLL